MSTFARSVHSAREVTLDSVPHKIETAISAEIDGCVVALDVDEGVCYGLNPVATRIWELIGVPTTLRDVCAVLLTEFDVTQDVCETETVSVVSDLVAIGLIRV